MPKHVGCGQERIRWSCTVDGGARQTGAGTVVRRIVVPAIQSLAPVLIRATVRIRPGHVAWTLTDVRMTGAARSSTLVTMLDAARGDWRVLSGHGIAAVMRRKRGVR